MELNTPQSPTRHRHAEDYRNVGDSDRKISLAAGAGSLLYGLKRGGLSGLALSAVGGVLMYRGASGHCGMLASMGRSTVKPADQGLFGERSGPRHFTIGLTIRRSPEELYQFWRGFTRLPEFMKYIKEVRPGSGAGTGIGERSHWVAETPIGGRLEWEAEVIHDVPNESISWRSLEGSDVPQQGEIRFHPGPDGTGTEVELDVRYYPPAGKLGQAFGGLLNTLTKEAAREDLRRFKRLMETGEIPTGSSHTAPPSAADRSQAFNSDASHRY